MESRWGHAGFGVAGAGATHAGENGRRDWSSGSISNLVARWIGEMPKGMEKVGNVSSVPGFAVRGCGRRIGSRRGRGGGRLGR